MPETAFDIASRALVRIGHPPITSFDEGSTGATVAAQEYEPLVGARLSEYRWRFATTQQALAPLLDTPVDRWTNAWQAPADAIAIHAVLLDGRPVAYDRYGDKIFANVADGLTCDYTFRQVEARWLAKFTDCIVQELAGIFALSVARDKELAAEVKAGLERNWAKARLADAQQQSARRLAPSRLIAVRR